MDNGEKETKQTKMNKTSEKKTIFNYRKKLAIIYRIINPTPPQFFHPPLHIQFPPFIGYP